MCLFTQNITRWNDNETTMFRSLTRALSGVFREEKAALVPVEQLGGQSSALSFSLSPSHPRRRVPPPDDGCALARECAKTKILRTPSRRAQRALVSRRSRCAQIRAESAAHLAARNEEVPLAPEKWPRRGRGRARGRGSWDVRAKVEADEEKGRRVVDGGEPAMNDCNQRNTAPRKLPGIHPEYIIHTGGGASTSLGQGVAYPGTAPKQEKRAREEPHDRPRHADGASRAIAVAFDETTPSSSVLLIVRWNDFTFLQHVLYLLFSNNKMNKAIFFK